MIKRNIAIVLFGWIGLWAEMSTAVPQSGKTIQRSRPESLNIEAPERMILGQDESAVISFDIPQSGTARLVTNVGQVSQPVEAISGRFEATYTAPAKRKPQVALIAVLSEQRMVLDWVAIPLHGKARIESSTEAGASVSIRIAGENFGPATAGDDGKTSIDVIVPPGVKEGTTIATDTVGNAIRTPIPLETPAFNPLLSVCPVSGDRFYVLALDRKGRAAARAAIAGDTTKGKLGPLKRVRKGVFVFGLEVEPDMTEPETVVLSATLGKHETSCELQLDAAPLPEPEMPLETDEPEELEEPAEPEAPPPEPPPTEEESSKGRPPLSFGLRAGYATNFGKVTAFALLADLIFALPILDENLSIGLESGVYFNKKDFNRVSFEDPSSGEVNSLQLLPRSDSSSPDSDSIEIMIWNVPIIARVSYHIPFQKWALYGGIGGGVILHYARAIGEFAGEEEDGSFTAAGSALIGAEVPWGPGRAVLELEVLPSFLGALNDHGNLGGMFITLGYRFNLLY